MNLHVVSADENRNHQGHYPHHQPVFAALLRGISDEVYLVEEKINYMLRNTEEDFAKERLYLDVVLENSLGFDHRTMAEQDYLSDLVA